MTAGVAQGERGHTLSEDAVSKPAPRSSLGMRCTECGYRAVVATPIPTFEEKWSRPRWIYTVDLSFRTHFEGVIRKALMEGIAAA